MLPKYLPQKIYKKSFKWHDSRPVSESSRPFFMSQTLFIVLCFKLNVNNRFRVTSKKFTKKKNYIHIII